MPRTHFTRIFFSLLVLLLTCAATPTRGRAEDAPSFDLLTGEPEPTFTASRFPRPTSKIAENVTVVTAADITRINAHTLDDVLQSVPGIQLDYARTPGSFTYFNIQGAMSTHVLVLIDGVPQNRLLDKFTDAGLMPVQQIERVEIIKGAASAAWGQALGGVVNVITKSPESGRPAGGTVSGSIGERFTADSRGELSGTINRFGYYLSAGNLHSDGLRPNNGINENNVYAKFVYDLPTKGNLTLGVDYQDAFRGLDEALIPSFGVVHDTLLDRRIYSFLTLSQPLADKLTLELTLRHIDRKSNTRLGHFDQGVVVTDDDYQIQESSRAGGAKLTWGDSRNSLTAGVEYEHAETKQQDLLVPNSGLMTDRTWDDYGIYANGAVSLGPVTILPGIRFDHTGVTTDYFSYTLGATWRLTEKTVLRSYGARGYSLPNTIFGHGPQKVWTVQAGAETGEIPYLWLKGTYFYNILENVEDTYAGGQTDQVRHGVELEIKTVPVYDLSLAGGYTFIDAWNRNTGVHLQTNGGQSVPPHALKLALSYNNKPAGISGVLAGNYVWWNTPASVNARYKAMIWDLHLNWKFCPKHELSPELFFSGHNLFNGTQTVDGNFYTNTPRWFEGGVRFKF